MRKKRTHDEFIFDVREKNPNIIIINKYTNNNSYVSVKCKKCGHTWSVIAQSLLHGHGCPKCAGNLRKTHSEFISEMSMAMYGKQPRKDYKEEQVAMFVFKNIEDGNIVYIHMRILLKN